MRVKKFGLLILLTLVLTACGGPEGINGEKSATEVNPSPTNTQAPSQIPPTIEVVETPVDTSGYYLYAPMTSTITYLMDEEGNTVHTWESEYNPGASVYLLENGNLLRTGSLGPQGNETFKGGGSGGIVEEIGWNGNVVWSFEYSSSETMLHHDIEQMPNGNILMIAWEYMSSEEAIAAGRDPNTMDDNELWPDTIIEVDPTSNQIVWEWRVSDHLIQDYDASKLNYGVVTEHPELIDVNYEQHMTNADWTHFNSIDYNPILDQIMVSAHGFDEIWIIDHSTTTIEAASHSGGDSGMGGDLLYRWGNPPAYQTGTSNDQQLFGQHNAQWIKEGLVGAGNLLIFNNGDRDVRAYSTVVEITPPINSDGSYTLVKGTAYGPTAPTWTYMASTPTDFYSMIISGTQRLPNGNTLITDGQGGCFFEVTPDGDRISQYLVDKETGTSARIWACESYVSMFGPDADGERDDDTEQTPVPRVPSNNWIFRAVFYSSSYSGLSDLIP